MFLFSFDFLKQFATGKPCVICEDISHNVADPVITKHGRISPLYSCSGHDVQKPSGTDKLVAEQDTLSVLLQVFQMYSVSWRDNSSQLLELQFWPLTGPLRIIGFPDASYRNNGDGSSQRDMTVFSAESRERSSKDGMSYGSLIDYASQKIKMTLLSTFVVGLLFHEMFWFMPVSPWIMDEHVW